MTHARSGAKRSRRGRILIVDDLPLVERLHGTMDRRVAYAANLFDAVGELATGDAVDAILLPEGSLNRPAPDVAEAIRRVDQSVGLYLILESGHDPSSHCAEDAGFDGILMTPISAAMLMEVVDGDDPFAPASEQTGDVQVDLSETDVDVQPVPSTMSSEVDVPAAQEEDDLPDHLGDSDLVRLAIELPHRIEEAAMRLLRQETGWVDARLDPEGEPSTDGVAVQYAGHELGRLVAPGRSVKELEPWAAWLGCWLALAQSHIQLQRDAYTDPLTGAWNRRYFDEFLPLVLDNARSRRSQVAIMVFDVDDLKKYNDTFGHDAGDTILRETVRLLQSTIRRGDQVFRVGGDEFVVVFSDLEGPRKPGSKPLESVDEIAQRFRAEIARMHFPKLGIEAPGSLSISAGMATYPWDGTDGETLLKLADDLARESKRRGKNALTIGDGRKQ